MDGSRTAWESPVSPTCLPNGPASAKCLASQSCTPSIRTEAVLPRDSCKEGGIRARHLAGGACEADVRPKYWRGLNRERNSLKVGKLLHSRERRSRDRHLGWDWAVIHVAE
jgi:hypothetical protein